MSSLFSYRRAIRDTLETVGAALALGAAFACFGAAVDVKAADATGSYELVAVHAGEAYALDTGMSGEDCVSEVDRIAGRVTVELEDGRLVVLSGNVRFSCELVSLKWGR